jgi:hypothetical protein
MLLVLQECLVLCVSGLWKEWENMPEIMSSKNKLLTSSISHRRQAMRVLTVNVRRIVHTRAKRNTTIARGWVCASPNYTEQSCGWLCVRVHVSVRACARARVRAHLENYLHFKFKCCQIWHCVIRYHSASNTLSYPRRLHLQQHHCGNPTYWE